MVYDIMLYSFLILVACVQLSGSSSVEDPFDTLGTLALMVFIVAAVIGIANFIFSSRAPLKEYAQELHQQMPSLKGKLICDDNTLTFKGTFDTKFQWGKQTFQVAYPTSTEVSAIATACGLGIKPETHEVATKLEEQSAAATKAIEATLTSQEVPKGVSPEESRLLNRLLMTLNPVDPQKITVLNTDGPDDAKLQVKEPSSKPKESPAVVPKVPKQVATEKKTASKSNEPTVLSTQDLLRNISAQ